MLLVLTDTVGPRAATPASTLLRDVADLEERGLGDAEAGDLKRATAVLFDLAITRDEPFRRLSDIIGRDKPIGQRRVFLLDPGDIPSYRRATALGADRVLMRPIDRDRLREALGLSVKRHGGIKAIVGAGELAIERIIAAGRGEASLTPADVADHACAVADGIADLGIERWMAAIRNHHSQTFQHCLLVTGFAVTFGRHLGFSARDVERLASGGLLHDVGKARIPLAILEKPGPLDAAEQEVMRGHAEAGRDILTASGGFPDEMVDLVVHHHEYLDGSGYPDGLTGHQISDLVRMMTIADVFGALVEKRSYKPPMDRRDAYAVLQGMEGKLDPALVRAFESVAHGA